MKHDKNKCIQEKQYDEKHRFFFLEDHSKDEPFDHPRNQEKHIL